MLTSQESLLKVLHTLFGRNLGEKFYMLNFYLPLALTCLPLFLPFGREILFRD
jgi:hypothetical protein